MKAKLSRRSFLVGAASVAALATGGVPLSETAASEAPLAAKKSIMWAAGTPGEMDWVPIESETGEAAFSKWLELNGHRPETVKFNPESVVRVRRWDGKTAEEVTPADWIRAGMGHSCSRCDSETMSGDADIIDEQVVCRECLSYSERLELDEDEGHEALVELIYDKGEQEAMREIARWEPFEDIPAASWAKACAEVTGLKIEEMLEENILRRIEVREIATALFDGLVEEVAVAA